MTNIEIKDGRKVRPPFVQICKAFVLDKTISLETRMTVTIMESRDFGWNFNVKEIKETCGYGEYIWRNVSKEMTNNNILSHKKNKNGTTLIYHGLDAYEKNVSLETKLKIVAPKEAPIKEKPPVENLRVGLKKVDPPVDYQPLVNDALNNNHDIKDHGDHDQAPQIITKILSKIPHDIENKKKDERPVMVNTKSLNSDDMANYGILLSFSWPDYHAIAVIKKYPAFLLHNIFEAMHKKKNIKNKGAYIRASLRKYDKEHGSMVGNDKITPYNASREV